MQYQKGLSLIGVLCLVILSLSACSSVPKASSSLDRQAKLFKTHPQKSNLYIYRDDKGSSVEMQLEVDGQLVATSVGDTYVKLEVEPGRHKIISYADDEDRLMIAAIKGKNYFIYQSVETSGGRARTQLNLVREAEGKRGVQASEMIATAPLSSKVSMRR